MTWSPAASTSPCRRRRCSASRCSASGWPNGTRRISCCWRCWRRFAWLCGAINGLLVLAAGLPPLLATLSTSVAFTGLTDLLTGQRRIAVSDPLMVAFRDNSVLGLPWPLVYLLGVFILFQFLLHHSRFGQHVQAVGGNRDMAQMSGLNVRRLTLLVWLLAGIAAGLAILPLLSQGSGSSSGTATPLLLETVLATFIGAAFSRRRVVTIWGALLGAILVNALSNGLGLAGGQYLLDGRH